MKSLLCFVIVAAGMLSPVFADDEQTLMGKISDSDCGATHKAAAEHEAPMSDADCTAACIKSGASYVFVTGGKVLKISNQDFADLPIHAGHEVRVTGEVKGDSINVTKIEMPKKE